MRLTDLAGRSILILGLGREGLSTYRYVRSAFPATVVGLADQAEAERLDPAIQQILRDDVALRLHAGSEYLVGAADYDVIVRTPGIRPDLPELVAARARGTRVTSQTALFLAECGDRVVGITGTKGKSTTTSLIFAALRAGGLDVELVGNIGRPSLSYLVDDRPTKVYVYELSSYQLADVEHSPHVAVLLDVVPEHLNYHGTFESYLAAKSNITRFQSNRDYLVYNPDFATPSSVARSSSAQLLSFRVGQPVEHGGYTTGDDFWLAQPGQRLERVLTRADVPLLGEHNVLNVLAAVTAAKAMRVPSERIAEGIRSFQPLEHRLEPVGTYRGVAFYNDSLATVPEAAMAAMRAIGSGAKTLILGGFDRGLDFSELGRAILEHGARTLILFPTTGRSIEQAVQAAAGPDGELPAMFHVESMEVAVRLAYEHTQPGEACLMSPASPSFNIFRDYRERGEAFKELVRRLGST
ncbi:MAG: UDP-N-acetylmuramoyl-L-alanine--D-glutamate ligase [Chloroflexi bacterium]|nr:UDP-N-acetylmuramoyl-L-alanine--D-glutamate ligase [Chloroflexota bacterium]